MGTYNQILCHYGLTEFLFKNSYLRLYHCTDLNIDETQKRLISVSLQRKENWVRGKKLGELMLGTQA